MAMAMALVLAMAMAIAMAQFGFRVPPPSNTAIVLLFTTVVVSIALALILTPRLSWLRSHSQHRPKPLFTSVRPKMDLRMQADPDINARHESSACVGLYLRRGMLPQCHPNACQQQRKVSCELGEWKVQCISG
eukprot:15461967-Alexandrium_andersonii.AAC.1